MVARDGRTRQQDRQWREVVAMRSYKAVTSLRGQESPSSEAEESMVLESVTKQRLVKYGVYHSE